MMEIENFKVLKKIGEGATSDVYLGEDLDGKQRALKVFNQFLPQAQGDLTFNRELENLSQFRNDKIVSVYGLDKTSTGKWVLIQEFIDGISLREYLNSEIDDLDRVILALVATTEVLYALEESHRKGIIHRDIKPENILLENSGRVVLSDFGLSKNLNINQESLHGNLFGSPQYMSMGQFSGSEASEYIDVYAIAVLLYEIIAKRAPFKGQNIDEIFMAKKNGEYTPLYKLNPYTPIKVSKIIDEILGDKEKKTFDKAFKIRFELLSVLESLGVDQTATVKTICAKEKLVEEELMADKVQIILNQLEVEFDNKRSDKLNLLGQILKLDPVNKRGNYKRKSHKFIFLLIIFGFAWLVGFLLRPEEVPSPEKEILKKVEVAPIVEKKIEAPVIKEAPKKVVEKARSVVKKKVVKPKKKIIPKKEVIKTGSLIVNIPSDIKVFVDDRRVYKVNERLPLEVGKHEITLAKDGHKSISYIIEIEEGKDTIINLD